MLQVERSEAASAREYPSAEDSAKGVYSRRPVSTKNYARRSHDTVVAEQIDHKLPAIPECGPDRLAPAVNGPIALGSSGNRHDVEDGDRAANGGQRKSGPALLLPRQRHMNSLGLACP